MAEHDFRYTLLSPQHTLNECRTLAPGRYQVTGIGGSVMTGDTLLVSLKGSQSLHMRLVVEKVRRLINPPGQWLAVTSGPVFKELAIHQWSLKCDACGQEASLEFAADATLGESGRLQAAEARAGELGWETVADGTHRCPRCVGAVA